MKKAWILVTMCAVMLLACSTDGTNNDAMNANQLVGSWLLVDARFPESSSLNLIDEIVEVLNEQGCTLVTITFAEGGTGTLTEKINFIQTNAGAGGLMVDCPTQSNTNNFTWSLEESQLTVTFENEASRTTAIELSGDTLIIDGAIIDENNLSGSQGEFIRQ